MIDDNLRLYLGNAQSPLLIAVSGGMDSVVLLHLLVKWREKFPCVLHVATFDHAIRPDSVEDVRLVVDLCHQWNVSYTMGRVERSLTGNIESSARQARYQFFAKVAHQVGAEWVLTAHHADDQAETILLHILRGAGLRGLGGMEMLAPLPYDDSLKVFRPMLTISRSQVEAYCQEHDLPYRHDVTNDDVAYRRNYIRHHLLPMMATINEDVVGALNRLGESARTDYDFLSSLALNAFEQALIVREDRFIALKREYFLGLHESIQRQLLFIMAWECYQQAPTYERVLEAFDTIRSKKVGSFIEFVGHNRLYLDYDALILGDYQSYLRHTTPYIRLARDCVIEIDLDGPSKIELGAGWQLLTTPEMMTDYQMRLSIAGVDQAVIRTRREGDYFAPAGLKGRGKKLKAWMIDRKIPQVIRDEIALIEFDGVIVAVLYGEEWTMGYQKSDHTGKYLYINKLSKNN